MDTEENIVLVGYMGSGKTSISRALQELSGRNLLDTDEEIARRAGKPVSAIFTEEGEAAFRDMESSLLEELMHSHWSGILSTGGGMPLREENRRLLRGIGTVFYLNTSPETICARLEGDGSRPLLAGLSDPAEKLARIRGMLSQREECYLECAHISLATDNGTPESLAAEILLLAKSG